MKIKHLKLHNVKSYQEAYLEFSPRMNIIIGDNNSGKSTIIRTIDRFQGGAYQGDNFVRNGQHTAFAEIKIENINSRYFDLSLKENEDDYYTKVFPEIDHMRLIACSRRGNFRFYQGNEETPPFSEVCQSNINIDGSLEKTNTSEFKSFPTEEPHNVFYASYSRRGYFDAQISGDRTNQIRQDLNNLGSRLQKLSNSGHPGHGPFITACESILGFVPGVIPQGRDRSNSLSIGVYTDNTDTIDINGMGQGVLQITGLLTILFTQKNKIILLEEIENDLHPKVLKQLLELIIEKSIDNQFIVSTHSNIVLKHLGAVSDSKIFKTSWNMDKEGDHKLPLSKVTEIQNDSESRMKVLNEMGYDVMDFELWQGYLLFEESTAELIVKDILIPFFIPSLKGRLRTIASQGVDDVGPRFKSFLSLFVFIHLSGLYRDKAWVLVDGDDAGQKVVQDLHNTYFSWDKGHFQYLKESDFEYYYPSKFQEKANQVLKMAKGNKKQEAKVDLRKEVVEWSLKNQTEAKEEWTKSAIEVIEFLRLIEKSLPK